MDDDIRAIQWTSYSQTALEPATAVIVAIACALTFILPRRTSVLPMIVVATLIPYPQRIVLAGVGFDMVRIVIICALARVLGRKEMQSLQLTRMDKAFLAYSTLMFLVPLVTGRNGIGQQLGFILDNILEYIVFRAIITDEGSLKLIARTFVLLSLVVCAGMLLERRMEKNWFYLLGSFMEVTVREGEIRATAAFDHPILAGTFGALLFPIAWLLRQGRWPDRALWIIGMLTSILIVAASKSSGPQYAFASGLLALGLWPLRKHIRGIRNVTWAVLLFFHLIMNAPVWALLFRIPAAIGLVSGSTSYHRFELIDLAIKHIGEWWLTGISIDDVARWEWGINDITNQFLWVGFSSGLLGIIIFMIVLVRGFSLTGSAVRQQFVESNNPLAADSAWILGSLLFVHVMSFMGVSYFSGFWFFLNITFAIISARCAGPATVPVVEHAPNPARPEPVPAA